MMLRWSLASALAIALLLGACDGTPSSPAADGRLQVDVVGLPAGVIAKVTVRGPANFVRDITQSTLLTGLARGDYELWPSPIVTDSATYMPTQTTVRVTIGANDEAAASVAYTLTTGRLAVLLEGLPPGSAVKATVVGPKGYSVILSTSDTLGNLEPGSYDVSTANVTQGSDIYAPTPQRATVTVAAVSDPTAVQLKFSLISGSIAISVLGLPSTVPAQVRLAGPNGVLQNIAGTRTVGGLFGGLYTISADTVTSGAASWAPLPASQFIALATGSSGAASVNYALVAPPAGAQNLTIAGAHFQQVVQTFGGAVPLVAGRDALLRVFVLGSTAGIPAPDVRVRLYQGATLVATATIAPPAATAPTAVNEGSLSSSWNYRVAAALVQPGLAAQVDVDPGNFVPESSESDNAWPNASSPLTLQVRAVPPLAVRFVPISQAATGLTGRVSAANVDQFLLGARKLLPPPSVTSVIAPIFTTGAPSLVPTDSNGAWLQILSELNALRSAEGGSGVYFGVVQAPYSSGTAGLAYLNGRAALGWDVFPSATVVVAHELGHSMGRFHAPCGLASGFDVSYPYPRAAIGVYGYDAIAGGLIAPTAADVMSYCAPVWISDYTFSGMLNYWVANAGATFAASGMAPRPGLLVWGRIEHGEPILEPAFVIVAPPSLPRRSGANQLELVGEGQRILASLSFEAERVADVADSTAAHFAFVVPMDAMARQSVRAITLRSRGARTTITSATASAPAADALIGESAADGVVRLRWTDQRIRAAMVRDPAGGHILGFVRRGDATIRTRAQHLDVVVSDGVRSHRQLLEVHPTGGARRPPQ